MVKQTGKFLDPILFIGLLISLAISAGMVITQNDTLPGLTIGLLSTIITLLVDLIARVEKVKASLLEASELSKILSNESIGVTLNEIAGAYATIRKYRFNHYLKIADKVLNDCKMRFLELASGSVVVQSSTSLAYGFPGTKEATRNIKVVHARTMNFWNSDTGRKILAANKYSVKHGVQITRVFVISEDDVFLYRSNLVEQEKAGIRVYIVPPQLVHHSYLIIDEKVLVEALGEEEEGKHLEKIVLDTTEVQKRIDDFDDLILRHGKTIKQITSTKREAG